MGQTRFDVPSKPSGYTMDLKEKRFKRLKTSLAISDK